MKKSVWIVIIVILICLGLIISIFTFKSCQIKEPEDITTNASPYVSMSTSELQPTPTMPPPIGNANEKAPFNDNGTGLFYMDMSFDSFRNKVGELGWISYDEPSPDNTYFVDLFPNDNGIGFNFENNQLVYINVLTENIETEKGLKIGDSESQIRQLHGEPTRYNLDEYGVGYYYYQAENGIVLRITVWKETVDQWRLGYSEYVE